MRRILPPDSFFVDLFAIHWSKDDDNHRPKKRGKTAGLDGISSSCSKKVHFLRKKKQIAGEAGGTREPNKKPNVNTINLRQ